MQETRPAIIKIVVLSMMLAGLLFILPEERQTAEKNTLADYPGLNNASQSAIPTEAKTTSATATASYSIDAKTDITPANNKIATAL